MNQPKSHFRSELAIIPPVARGIAVLVFVVMQICLLGLVPHFVHGPDLPPMPALVAISLVAGFIVAVIILMIGYVYADSKRRGMNALLWTLLVIFVPKALGFIAYFLLRKPLLMPCPKWQWPIGSEFAYCPKCGYAVTPSCANCGRPIRRDYMCCP